MTMFQRIREAFFRFVSRLNKDDDDRAVFTGSEGDLTNFLAADLDKVLNEPEQTPLALARSSSRAA